jgi:hypothetical protein
VVEPPKLRLTPTVTRSPSAKTTDMQHERGDIPREKRSRFQQHRQPEAHSQGAVASRERAAGVRRRRPCSSLLRRRATPPTQIELGGASLPPDRGRPLLEAERRGNAEKRKRGSATILAHGLHSSSARRRRRARRAGTRACPQAAAPIAAALKEHSLLLPCGLTASSSPAAVGAAGRWRSLQAALPLRSLLYAHQSIEEHHNALSQPFIPINLNMHVVLLQL